MRRNILWLGLLGLLTACDRVPFTQSAPAAGGVTAATRSQAEVLVGALSRQTAKVVEVFPGPAGLVGVGAMLNGRTDLTWMTADGRYLIAGSVLNAQGQDAGAARRTAYAAADMARFWASTQRAPAVVRGSGPKQIYVFFDPNCAYCSQAFKSLASIENQATVHWIPVAFLKPDSMGRAVAILGADDPVAALTRNEQSFNLQASQGGQAPATTPRPEIVRKVSDNTVLLRTLGAPTTPLLVFEGAKGVEFMAGLGLQPAALLARVK